MHKRFTRVSALIRKELIQILRDRGTLLMILGLPLLEMFLFAYAVNMTVDHIPTAVADLSMGQSGQTFLQAMEISEFFDLDIHVTSEAAVIEAIEDGEAMAGIVIPPDFEAAVERGSGQVLVLLDGSDSYTVQSGYRAATAIAQSQSLAVTAEKLTRSGASGMSLPLFTSTRVLYNPNMDGMTFMVPGVVGMLLQMLTISSTAMSVVREHELGIMEQILITPARSLDLIVGKLVPNVLLAIVDLLIVLGTGIFWFKVPFQGSFGLFALLSLTFIISGLGMGLLVSTFSKTQKEAQQMSSMLLMLSMLLTGLIYPRANMPAAVKFVGDLIPVTYYFRIIRGIMTKGVGMAFMWQDALVLLIYGVVVMTVAVKLFKKRLD